MYLSVVGRLEAFSASGSYVHISDLKKQESLDDYIKLISTILYDQMFAWSVDEGKAIYHDIRGM